MVPLVLQLQGLYSYKSLQIIDFKKLSESQLFGIFGATGSGKSAILEAIVFALYNQSHRLNASEDRSYNMMNLQSQKMLIVFEFLAGKNGAEQFKVQVSGVRNKKNFEKVTIDRILYQWQENAWVALADKQAEIEKKIEDIVGLSYHNFKRTVIIPQGQFQDFLHLGAKDKTVMLKEIFQLEKFELYEKTAKLSAKNQLLFQENETLLSRLADVNEAVIQEVSEKIEIETQQILALSARLAEKQKQHQHLLEWQKLRTQLSGYYAQFSALEARVEEIENNKSTLIQYEYCRDNFATLLHKKTEAEQKSTRLSDELSQKNLQLEVHKKELKRLEQVFKDCEKNFNQRDIFKQKADELQQILTIRAKQEIYNETLEKLKKGTQLTEDEKIGQEKEKQDLIQKQQETEALEQTIPNIRSLLTLKEWHVSDEGIVKEITQAQQLLLQIQTQIQANQEQKNLVLEKIPLPELKEIHEYPLLIQHLENYQQQLSEDIEAQELHYEHLHRKAGWELKPDEPCPLCGAIEHTHIWDATEIAEQMQVAKSKRDSSRNQQKEVTTAIAHIDNLHRIYNTLQAQISPQQHKEQALLQQRKLHQLAFSWEEYKNISLPEIENELHKEALLQAQLKQKKEEIKETQQRWEASNAKVEKYESRLHELRLQEATQSSEIESLLSVLKYITPTHYHNTPLLEIVAEKERFQQQYDEIEKLYHSTQTCIEQIRKTVNQTEGEILSHERQHKETIKHLSEIQQELIQKLEHAAIPSLSQIQQILSQNIDPALIRTKIQSFEVERETCKQNIQQIETELAKNTVGDIEIAQVQAELPLLEQEITEKQGIMGALKKEASNLAQSWEEKQRLEALHEKLQARKNNLDILKKMFTASGFVEFVASSFLQQLCDAANLRFEKLTQGALSLETQGTILFFVRDYFNNGQLRSAKTLSGGQTFQAALSLALALSDSIQRHIQSDRSFFFLDEGFGSQDKDSLRLIMETLQSLKKENRTVGVISHVEEMQQEMDYYLHVQKTERDGSLIYGNWETAP